MRSGMSSSRCSNVFRVFNSAKCQCLPSRLCQPECQRGRGPSQDVCVSSSVCVCHCCVLTEYFPVRATLLLPASLRTAFVLLQIRCPVEHCEKGQCPDCITVCKDPVCRTECINPPVRSRRAKATCALRLLYAPSAHLHQAKCRTACAPPVCDWQCRRPNSCPRPKCALVCDRQDACHPSALASTGGATSQTGADAPHLVAEQPAVAAQGLQGAAAGAGANPVYVQVVRP